MLRVSVAALHPPAVTAELYKINYLPDLETCGLTRGAMCYMVKVLKGKVEECAERDLPLARTVFISPGLMLEEELSSYYEKEL